MIRCICYLISSLMIGCYSWYPGTNGNLANPKATYLMNSSTAMWFVGNDTGMNNQIELTAEAQYGAIGIGWEVNNKLSNYTNEDQWAQQTSISLKKLNPNLFALAPRNTECVGIIWNVVGDAINSNRYDLFLTNPKNSTEIYLFPWYGNGYHFPSAFINFLSNDSINWWLTNWMEPAIKNNNFDGIYWDHCGPNPNNILTPQQVTQWNQGSQFYYNKAIEMIQENKKWSMSWYGYYFNANNINVDQCTSTIKNYIQIGNNPQLDLTLIYNYKNIGKYDGELWTAIFLITRGKSGTLMMSVIGAYDYASVGYVYDKSWNIDYGEPIQNATEIHTNIFFRQWSKANITFNCNNMTYKIDTF